MRKSFFMLNAAIGAMTAAERSKGRYMRAPDGHDAEFEAFQNAGEVEVGKPAIESNQDEPEAKPAKPARGAKAAADAGKEKPAVAAAEKAAGKGAAGADDAGDEEGETVEGEEDDEEEDEDGEKPEKKPKKASDRIRELNARLRQSERLRIADQQRIADIEKRLQGGAGGSNNGDGKPAPDPTDTAKYPLGHLDDRYIEDKLEYLAEIKAGKQADAVLQRQQEGEQARQAEKAHAELLDKVDYLATRGSEIYDDFQESVIDAGMRGDWHLEKPTFEAAHEADNGAIILYELSQDKKEAARVASLSPYQQMKFVMDRDAEITAKGKPRTKPGATPPPATRTNGANSRTRINPATENLDDFEKAWLADEKGK